MFPLPSVPHHTVLCGRAPLAAVRVGRARGQMKPKQVKGADGNLIHFMLLAQVDEIQDVFLEARPPEPRPAFKKLGTKTWICANGWTKHGRRISRVVQSNSEMGFRRIQDATAWLCWKRCLGRLPLAMWSMSAPEASQTAERELTEEMRCARNALAMSLATSADHTLAASNTEKSVNRGVSQTGCATREDSR